MVTEYDRILVLNQQPSASVSFIDGRVLRTKDRERRFEIYRKANEYIADQALWAFTLAPLGLYGVNKEVHFVPQMSQFLYLDYSSVTENHWSVRSKND